MRATGRKVAKGGRPPVMNIVVCVKQVPDTWSERTLQSSDSTLDRDAADAVINELDEYAIEEGLRQAEAHGGEVTILSMGPERASESIRKALSMGADKAVHVIDAALHGSDGLVISAVLAQVLGRIGFDLVILGSESTDARMGVMAAMLAERLGIPQLSQAGQVVIDGTAVTIHRQGAYGYDTGRARLPGRVAWHPAAVAGRPGGDRRNVGHHSPAGGLRLRHGRGEPAGRSERGREDQRAAVSVLQGDHGGQEEARRDAESRRPRHREGSGGPGRERDRSGELRQPPAASGRHDRHRRRRWRQQGGRVPRGAEVHLSGLDLLAEGLPHMAEILVLADHEGEAVKKVTLELLTLARRFGEPAAVWTGEGAAAGRDRLAEYGAAKVYVADGPEFDEYVTAPQAELLASLVAEKSP